MSYWKLSPDAPERVAVQGVELVTRELWLDCMLKSLSFVGAPGHPVFRDGLLSYRFSRGSSFNALTFTASTS